MVSRLFPLGVKLNFEDRPYKLGETINLTIQLDPRGDTEVREGRVDLVCEERWREVFTVMVRPRGSWGGRSTAGATGILLPRVPRQVTQTHREAYVHSSVVFLAEAQLQSGTTGRYNARLEIQPEPPPHAEQGAVSWRLVATVDVAHARDIKARRSVKVALA